MAATPNCIACTASSNVCASRGSPCPGNHETTWSESACTTFGRLFGNDGRLAFRAGGYLFVGFTAAPT